MKIRTGFVSNSSSSSFVIITKKKMTAKMLLDKFAVPKKSVLYRAAVELAEVVVNSSEEVDEEGYRDVSYLGETDELPDYIAKAFSEGKHVYCGSICNENYDADMESWLYNNPLTLDDSDITVIND